MKNKLPTLGFIGTGTITTAMVTGFCSRAADAPYPIVLSPKSENNAAMLKAAFPSRVTVAASMQEVVELSDWVILAVLPEAGEEVCRSLRFRPAHKVINVMFDKTAEQIQGWLNCKVDTLLHMIPLTFNEFTDGPIVQCPPTPEAAEIFGHIGKVISVEQRYQAAVFGALTACVTPMFALFDTLIEWARSEGVNAELATDYITNFFAAVCQQAVRQDRAGVHTMATVSTPGGINLQNLELIRAAGGFQAWEDAMRPVFTRTVGDIPKE